jgi:hypothetical protein
MRRTSKPESGKDPAPSAAGKRGATPCMRFAANYPLDIYNKIYYILLMKKNKILQVAVDSSVCKWVAQEAKRLDISVSAVIRKALNVYFKVRP